MNKLLKDAIADAKAVRETALANAKLALEEAFQPQLQRIFSEKIKHEMEEDVPMEEEDSTMEASMDMENEMMNSKDPKDRMKELAGLEEYDEFEDDEDDDDDFDDDLSDIEDYEPTDDEKDEFSDSDDEDAGYDDEEPIDADLEEIIRQLEEDEMKDEMADDMEEGVDTARPDRHQGEANRVYTEGEKVKRAMEDEDEWGDLDMAGEPDGTGGSKHSHSADGLDEEIDLDEVIAALREDEDFEDGEKKPMQENMFTDILQQAKEIYDSIPDGIIGQGENALNTKMVMTIIMGGLATGLGVSQIIKKIEAAAKAGSKTAGKVSGFIKGLTSYMGEGDSMEDESKMEELEEAYSVIEHLREKINEVNLLNAKLLYVNKLFKKHNLSESEKVRVVETFDRAVTVRETKIIYTTLSESLSTRVTKKTKVMTEGFASSPVKKTEILTESNSIVSRFQKLAGLTNED